MKNIYITPYALAKYNAYGTEALLKRNSEIGGLARLQVGEHSIHVLDMVFFKQTAQAAHFTFEAEEVTKFIAKMVQDGKTDEIHQWCSIVHTHPSGMSATMSSTDVDELKKFAQEQDAFSLIMPASRSHDKPTEVEKLRMHYCNNNGRLGKSIIADQEVGMSYMKKQNKLADKVGNMLIQHYRVDGTDEDSKYLRSVAFDFARWNIGLLPSERDAIVEEAKLAVPHLIERPKNTYGRQSQWSPVNNAYAWRDDDYYYDNPNLDTKSEDKTEVVRAIEKSTTDEITEGDWVYLDHAALEKYRDQALPGAFEDLRTICVDGGFVTEVDNKEGVVLVDGMFIIEEEDLASVISTKLEGTTHNGQ